MLSCFFFNYIGFFILQYKWLKYIKNRKIVQKTYMIFNKIGINK